MTPDEHADYLRDAVRHVPGGGTQHLEALLQQANRHDELAFVVRVLADTAWHALDGDGDRQIILENLIKSLRRVTA